MRHLFIILFILAIRALPVKGKATQSCQVSSLSSGNIQRLPYTITKTQAEDSYTTYYYLLDNNKLPYKIISASNNTKLQTIHVIIRNKSGEVEDDYPLNYNRFSGLIITEAGDSVPRLNKDYNYIYLLSFDDPGKKYVNVHYLTRLSLYTVLFSRISDSLLYANNEYLKQAAYMHQYEIKQQAKQLAAEKEQKKREEYEHFTDSIANEKVKALLATNKTPVADSTPKNEAAKVIPKAKALNDESVITGLDSMFKQFIADSNHVLMIWNAINDAIRKHSPEDFEIEDENRYAGQKNNGSWQGQGLMIQANRRIYSGTFEKGQFVKGEVTFRYENNNRYTGEYERARPFGLGQLTTQGNDIQLGYFGESGFEKGIIRAHYYSNSRYFGQWAAEKRNGYGIFTAPSGNLYIGCFKDNVLSSGFTSETDETGLKNYYSVIDSVKKPIEAIDWNNFWKQFQNLKSMYKIEDN